MVSREGKGGPGISYFMPLSNGARPLDGPAKCVFSSPSYSYSPETQAVVKNLMDESRLTSTQKTGFQSILRSGKPLPVRPTDLFKQQLYKHRHAERARYMGMAIMNPSHNPFMSRRSHFRDFYGGRRSYDTIQATVEMDKPVNRPRKYVSRDKEQEKIRFAHRMAYGKDPPPKEPARNPLGKGIEPLITKLSDIEISDRKKSLADARFAELIGEIKERTEFMESMRVLGNDKAYKGTIVSQIQKLVAEMKTIYPDKVDAVLGSLQLDKVDNIFSKDGYEFNNILIEKNGQYEDYPHD